VPELHGADPRIVRRVTVHLKPFHSGCYAAELGADSFHQDASRAFPSAALL
jgi:hypothetical protein